MIRINDIIDRVTAYSAEADLDLIDRAYIFSARAHAGQVRLSGEPYLSHPLEVAGILADMKLDAISIASGLLHDVVEDTQFTEDDVRDMFGKEVALLVAGVTRLGTVPLKGAKAREAEDIRKMFLAMADDIRVILIKLADRLHNMRTLKYHKAQKTQQKIARETMDIFAPMAARLGIYWIKSELENRSFYYLQPGTYTEIEALVNKEKQAREEYIESVQALITQKMAEKGLSCEVQGRFKNYYSIYRKMVTQALDFEDVYDIIAFRIILDTDSKCYEALGHIHSLWKPIDGKIKDYIARPKPNMYQSLHTTVIGPVKDRMEIQIRTHEMDQVANSGIAAHWRYKEGGKSDKELDHTYAWIRDLVASQESIQDPDEYLENVRIDLFPEAIYVFTPRGDIMELPRGATPIDFAYKIHTDVGHQCVGAKVNGRMIPLRAELKTGQHVEVVTNKQSTPGKDWLEFVKTSKARSRIRNWVKTQEKERSINLGREMCEKAFRKQKLNFNTLSKKKEMDAVVADFGFKKLDDLLADVGYGKTTPLQIIRKIVPKDAVVTDGITEMAPSKDAPSKKKGDGITVQGMDDMLIRFGNCCQPVPGDPVIGYISRGQGVTVHHAECKNVARLDHERYIDVEWDSSSEAAYPVDIFVESLDRVGLLADMAGVISKSGANIISANTATNKKKEVSTTLTVMINDHNHLIRLLADLREVRNVRSVRKLK